MKNSLLIVMAILGLCPFMQVAASEHSSHPECSIPDNIPPQPSIGVWLEVRHHLSSQLESCLNSSDFFALYGASLLYTGDTSKALEMLERALLINPNNGSARIDYAEALYQSGQLISAIQVNQALINTAQVPMEIMNFLLQRQSAWKSRLHYWNHQISYLYGHSSNLNNATYIEELDLTLSGQRFPVFLDNSAQAHSGPYNYLGIKSQRYSLTPQGTSLFTFSLRARDSDVNESDTAEFSLSYELERESLNIRSNWNFALEHLVLGNHALYSALEGNWRATPRNSNTYFNLESRYISFSGENALDELSIMARPGLVFSTTSSRIGIELGIGVNNEIDSRPGGDRGKKEITLFYDLALFGGRFTSKLNYADTEDHEGYSPILEFNDKRRTESWSTTLQYFYPISPNLIIHSSYFYRNQDSNIDLFKTKTESIDLGFTYRF